MAGFRYVLENSRKKLYLLSYQNKFCCLPRRKKNTKFVMDDKLRNLCQFRRERLTIIVISIPLGALRHCFLCVAAFLFGSLKKKPLKYQLM